MAEEVRRGGRLMNVTHDGDKYTRDPVEVDTRQAKLYDRMVEADAENDKLIKSIEEAWLLYCKGWSKPRDSYAAKKYPPKPAIPDLPVIIQELEEKFLTSPSAKANVSPLIQKQQGIAIAREKAIEKYNDGLELYEGWSQYFQNAQTGLIHADFWCSYLHIGKYLTKVRWNPELSGKSYEAAVTELGPYLCSGCFPTVDASLRQNPENNGLCPGSGTMDYVQDGTLRLTHAVSRGGTCTHCHKFVSSCSLNNPAMRKHKI